MTESANVQILRLSGGVSPFLQVLQLTFRLSCWFTRFHPPRSCSHPPVLARSDPLEGFMPPGAAPFGVDRQVACSETAVDVCRLAEA